MTVIIKIEVINGILYQWDNGRQIRIISPDEAVSEVHFANLNDKEALVVDPKEIDGVIVCDIPNILLQSGDGIIVYVMNCSEEIERTIASRQLYVSNRQKPKNYVYTETEIKSYTSLEKRIEELEEKGVSDEQIAKLVEEYFEENPIETGATTEQAEQIEKNKQDIGSLTRDKLDASKLPEAINTALAQAKESGQFDGKDGVDGKNGSDGKDGYTPQKNVDYFTQADKNELVTDVINALPTWQGGSY